MSIPIAKALWCPLAQPVVKFTNIKAAAQKTFAQRLSTFCLLYGTMRIAARRTALHVQQQVAVGRERPHVFGQQRFQSVAERAEFLHGRKHLRIAKVCFSL